MARYSNEAMEQVRSRNFERWLAKAIERHGTRFDYSHSRSGFRTQKKPLSRARLIKSLYEKGLH